MQAIIMEGVCGEQYHHHHHHHNHHQKQLHHMMSSMSPKKAQLQDLNIPPRKLLSRLAPTDSDSASKLLHSDAAALLQKFLPCNGDSSDDGFNTDSDPYSSDQFRMYEFKVRKCTRSRSHDWTDCPFAHPGEKARRRDPRRCQYSGTVCPEYRQSGSCSRGDDCECAHGVFECWLHPARYRTEACKDGKNCKRKVCFFAHSPRELRVLPAQDDFEHRGTCGSAHSKTTHSQHCCRYCCTLSPTSTLLDTSNFSPPMSPSLSPPLSPMKAVGLSGFAPVSLYSDRISACGSGDSVRLSNKGLSYQDVLIAELLGSLEGMSINEAIVDLKSGLLANRGLWVDVGHDNAAIGNDELQQQQMQFSLSPSTPINPPAYSPRNLFNNANSDNYSPSASAGNGFNLVVEKANESGLPGPDLGWVNDLLM